jgi:hypothetical protein
MIIQFQKSLIDSIQKYSTSKYSIEQSPSPEAIGIIVALIIVSILLIIFFVFVAYYLPWWFCYGRVCFRFAGQLCCDCIRCYYCCPCMENKAFEHQVTLNKNKSKIFVQDMLTAPDGSIIHLSNIRPVNNELSGEISFSNLAESNLI